MSQDIFQAQLEWANERGLFLHSSLTRKSVKGVYGMYADAPIKKNTLLASFPVNKLLTSKKHPFKEETENVGLNWIHAAAQEISSPNSNRFNGIFAGFEKLEDMRNYSSYFCTEDELLLLKNMNPMLFRWVLDAKRKADETIQKIQAFDSSLDEDLLLTIYLNYRSRAFHPEGIVPVLDQFNHSDLHGQPNTLENGKLTVYANKDCIEGEQVFISYGPKDLYSHAVHYNYFDPNGLHLVEFGRKNIQSVQNENDQILLTHLKKFFKVSEFNNQGQKVFFVSDPSVLLIDKSPSQGLVTYLRESCRVRLGANATEQDLMRAAAEFFVFLIDRQLQMNQVHRIKESSIPSRLKRFYHLLNKEREMLLGNRANITGSA